MVVREQLKREKSGKRKIPQTSGKRIILKISKKEWRGGN